MRYSIIVLFCLVFPIAARLAAAELDQSQTDLDAAMSAVRFAPLGQSFIPSQDNISHIILRMADPGGEGVGSHSLVNIREGSITGNIIASSEPRFLEDCFNFPEGPGCGLGGGTPQEVMYNFSSLVNVIPGNTYVMEVLVQAGGDGLNVGYSYQDHYLSGGYYKSGDLFDEDLWFQIFAEEDKQTVQPNILVSNNNTLTRYSFSGEYVDEMDIPLVPGINVARDLIVTDNANVAVYNGTFSPILSLYDGIWTSQSMVGWSTANNGTYGGIANIGDFVYVTDTATAQGGERGIVRFSLSQTQPAMRFLDTSDYIDITTGLDGKLYALRNRYGDLDVVDPETMEVTNTLDLGHTSSSRAVVADADGSIYMASWNGGIHKYDNLGQHKVSLPLSNDLYDIDIHASGHLVVSDRDGDVFVTDTNFSHVRTFFGAMSGAFVAFEEVLITEPELVYCDSRGNSTHFEWIDAVHVADKTLVSGDDDGYLSAKSLSFRMTKSEANTLRLTPGFSDQDYNENWKVWIDFNRNGEFEEQEMVYSGRSNGELWTSINLPDSVLEGETAMRISMKWGGDPENCEVFTYGEVEDHRLIIVP